MRRMKTGETAVLLALCAALLTAVWTQARGAELSSKVVRLHVIAASDSAADQAVKLRVRDAVLDLLTPALEGVPDTARAAEVIRALLPALEAEAERVSGGPAAATLSRENYPTREYEDFALPAGEYTSLRVVLGAGEGHNWWCVVYPPLCLQSVTACAETAGGFDESDVKLVTGADGEYEIRFRLLELWGEWTAALDR